MNRIVDFVIGGTQKGGTTALYRYLRAHPDICMTRDQEGHFFDREWHFQSTTVDYSKYHRLFDACPDRKLWGDKTPTYMYWYGAPKRIWQYNPKMKWILLLRNPIERAYSHWNMAVRRGMDANIDFIDAIRNEPLQARNALPLQDLRHSFVDRGFYSDQLRRVWFFFPKEQTLILKWEAFKANQNESLEDICRFLGVEAPSGLSTGSAPAPAYAPMERRHREYLAKMYENEIREVERLLDWDCSDWLSGTAV